jgi:hypothetical protein
LHAAVEVAKKLHISAHITGSFKGRAKSAALPAEIQKGRYDWN